MRMKIVASMVSRRSYSPLRKWILPTSSSAWLNQSSEAVFISTPKDRSYIEEKGWAKLRRDTAQVIARRLAPAYIANDGRQTPMRHGIFPPFIAQHATGCCCRNCLQKWHGIPKGRQLTADEQAYVVDVIMKWLHRKY